MRVSTGSIGRPEHILVCDDERHIVRLIQVNLERQGYTIEAAFNGIEALETMRARRPDLVILDTEMPVLNGWQVLEEMSADPELRDIPVVLLGPDDRSDGNPNAQPPTPPSVRVWLTKPFDPQRLLEALE